MSSPSSYSSIRLQKGKRVEQIKNLKQKDWMKACSKLGLYVDPTSGKGSHCAVYQSPDCPPEDSSCLVLTIPRKLYANIQRDFVKKLVFYGRESNTFTEDDVWEALGFKT